METIDPIALQDYSDLIKYDVKSYLDNYVSFSETQSEKVFSYYKGDIEPDQDAFNTLNKLMNDTITLFEKINQNRRGFFNYQDWIITDYLEKIKETLNSVDNCSRFLRSSILKGSYLSEPQIFYTTKQHQNLESVARNLSGSTDEQNDWVEIALQNALNEEDYTLEGGTPLKLVFKNNSLFIISSVIDNITTDTLYGKDFAKKIAFVDNDLLTLSPKDTLQQSVEILLNLRKNDNPQFREDGLDSSLIVGKTFNSVAYPTIFRQLFSTFKTDDTLASLAITNITQKQGSVEIELNIETVLFNTVPGKITV